MRIPLQLSIGIVLSLFFNRVWSPGSAVSAELNGVTWVVSQHGQYPTIQQALDVASDGDTIIVEQGVYPGQLTVDKSIHLIGKDWPVIDGGGRGLVVSLEAPGITMQGFEVRGSGSEPDRDHAGIAIRDADIQVENNRLYDVLFGIFVAQADRAVVRQNDITSKTEFDIARKGDAIRVWYSQDATVEDNQIHDARDLVAWYSENLVFRDNKILNGRYGVHLMYCNNAKIFGNVIEDNSVGIYVMYSQDVSLIANDIRRQRGPSGYALGFKDSDNVLAQDNLLVDNRAGVFMDGTPYRPDSFARFVGNIIAFNDIGVLLFSFVNHAEFVSNMLWENIQQTALQGSGKAGANTWDGNFWSDYTGFDTDGDDIGDVPYRSDRFFENLLDQEPRLRALLFSPAVQAIEFASVSFPVIKPQPKLEDLHPSVIPKEIPASALMAYPTRQVQSLALSGGILLLIGLTISSSGFLGVKWMSRPFLEKYKPQQARLREQDPTLASLPIVEIEGLSKRYGKISVLKEVYLKVYPAESLALWGENGAGKTTLLKAILGLVHFEGQVQVAGNNLSQWGKQARFKIGYVPQEAIFYDMSVHETLVFYTRLKKVGSERIQPLADRLGLLPHLHKPVPALSGGLKQRLALAVALLSDPPLLLLDEPTANLDARARKEYLELLLKLRKEGKTIVFASHRLDEVETLADRVVVLEAGQKTAEIRPAELRTRLTPQVLMTVWVAENQRPEAIELLSIEGWKAYLNGRGTVVIQLNVDEKNQALKKLYDHGIQVDDFDVEGVSFSWN